MAARSDAVAAARRYSATGDSRLARSREVQPERPRPAFESQRIFAARLGQSRNFAGFRSRAFRMGKENRERAREFRFIADHHAALSQGPTRGASILGSGFGRNKNDERPGPFMPVLFCRAGQGEIARRLGDDRSGR